MESMESIVTRLSFGLVVSSSSTSKRGSVARFDDLAEWMRANASLDLVSRGAPSYKDLAMSIREGSSDVAWLPPVAYAWLAEAVTPIGSILREGATTYGAALVVRADSKVHALKDLKNLRAGWVDRWSAAGYVVPRLELARAKVDLTRAFRSEKFYGSHRDALLALGKDECDIVGTYARLRSPESSDADQSGAWSEIDDLSIRVLTTFDSIPPDVIAVRRNLGPREHEQVIRAFRSACEDPVARPLVRAVFDGEELREGTQSGHEELRRSYEAALSNGLFDEA
jgi:ABC-type phosphate/phosphonate transport system substrate-binding protein